MSYGPELWGCSTARCAAQDSSALGATVPGIGDLRCTSRELLMTGELSRLACNGAWRCAVTVHRAVPPSFQRSVPAL